MNAPAYDYDTFATRVGEQFAMHLDDGRSVMLTLTDCTAVDEARRSFSLVFGAGRDAPAEQGTYVLEAEHVARIPIFLVPVRARPDGLDYQAVFNQVPSAAAKDGAVQ